jgi:carbonic anhydrase
MPDRLIANNATWARQRVAADPGYFQRLVAQQTPRYLWIGCADSRVPANEIVGLDPGEVFVHRNVANLAPAGDTNYNSVLQYALEVLKVQVVIVCGHYGCGGVRAAVRDQRLGLIDHWLQPIREVAHQHREELADLASAARDDRLCELNVSAQVRAVVQNPFVHDAWARGQPLEIVGFVYSLADGLLRQIEPGIDCWIDGQTRFGLEGSAMLR